MEASPTSRLRLRRKAGTAPEVMDSRVSFGAHPRRRAVVQANHRLRHAGSSAHQVARAAVRRGATLPAKHREQRLPERDLHMLGWPEAAARGDEHAAARPGATEAAAQQFGRRGSRQRQFEWRQRQSVVAVPRHSSSFKHVQNCSSICGIPALPCRVFCASGLASRHVSHHGTKKNDSSWAQIGCSRLCLISLNICPSGAAGAPPPRTGLRGSRVTLHRSSYHAP
eukprot:7175610-Prymnesium_polylepis.1